MTEEPEYQSVRFRNEPVIATVTGHDPNLYYMPLRLEDGDGLVNLREYLEGMEARLMAAIKGDKP